MNILISIFFMICFSAFGQLVLQNASMGSAYVTSSLNTGCPVISSVSSNVPGSNYAVITWTTDISTTNDWVLFSTDTSYNLISNLTAGGTSHSFGLSNLIPSTTYNFKPASAANGCAVTNTASSFTTAAFVPPSTFSPTNISGYPCYIWYPGDFYSAGTWLDGYTNSINMVQSTSGFRPTTGTLNGHQIVIFDGIDDFLMTTNAVLSSSYEVFVVFKYVGWQADKQSCCFYTTNSSFRMFARNNFGNFSAGQAMFVGPTPTNTYWVVDISRLKGGGNNSYVYTNGVEAVSTSSDEDPQGLTMGGRGPDPVSEFGSVNIAEFVYFRTNFTAGAWELNRSNVFCYLTNKYGLSVP